MSDKRFAPDEMRRLARSGVNKIDQLGPRGTTLCSMDEIEAMAALLVTSGALVEPRDLTMTRAERVGSVAAAIQPIEDIKGTDT